MRSPERWHSLARRPLTISKKRCATGIPRSCRAAAPWPQNRKQCRNHERDRRVEHEGQQPVRQPALRLVLEAECEHAAILLETSLSYLGLGVKPPDTSLGKLISDNQQAARTRPATVGEASTRSIRIPRSRWNMPAR